MLSMKSVIFSLFLHKYNKCTSHFKELESGSLKLGNKNRLENGIRIQGLNLYQNFIVICLFYFISQSQKLILLVFTRGLSGLDELEALDSRFSEFRESLFSPSSKSFERSVQTAQINRQVDERVESFLLLVSPYFTLKAAQKALEWLVCRYHIHQFNIDAWIMAVLPFHDANLFVRAIQLLYLKDEAGKWHWLKPLQKPGIPLPKGTLLNRVSRDIGLLKLICSQLDKAKKIHSGRPSVLATFIAFFTSNIVGMLEHSENVTEEQLGTLLPTLCAGLSGGRTQEKGAHNPDLAAGCYMIVAQLTRKAKLSPRAVENLTASIVMVRFVLIDLDHFRYLIMFAINS